jgi:hypothetical protein
VNDIQSELLTAKNILAMLEKEEKDSVIKTQLMEFVREKIAELEKRSETI